jgi:Asp-tRNA(Asn)/Glu-tRNA(Gln) amidotransferase A subunit family amidase
MNDRMSRHIARRVYMKDDAMPRNSNDDKTRREFLLSTGVFSAGVLASPALALRQQAPEGSAQSQAGRESATPNSIEPPASVAGVTKATFAQAEKLAGIQFTDAERQMMASTIGEQLRLFQARLNQPYPPNWLAPALVFDPRLAGPSPGVARKAQPLVRSQTDPGPLPRHDQDIAFAPVAHLSRWLERRQLTSLRLTEIYLDRLKQLDPKLKCVITLCEVQARRQAARADAEIASGYYRGPLHGVPWGAKDLLDTKGIPTTWGAEPFKNRVPESDAAVVQKLDQAGAVLIAKLSLGALAYNDIWFGGRTSNPWNLKQGSSGSSAGSAAATAAGLVGFAIGTETYGSITSPCMRCGSTGLRPTFGRVSRAGAMALCWSLDKIGPICRTVEDCALVLGAISGATDASRSAGVENGDPSLIEAPLNFDAARSVTGLRVGYSPKWFAEAESNELDRQALDAARRTGAKLVEINLPDWPYDILLSILLAEAAAAFEELTRSGRDEELKWQEPEAWPNTFRRSWFIPAIELVQADRFRRQCMQMMAQKFEHLHAIIGPSFAGSLCLLSNNTGHPSLTLRSGFNADGTPHGITLIGRLFDEGTLCRLGMALERELDVWRQRPAL